MPRLFLIDGSGYVHRAFHAVTGLTNDQGLPTGAVHGYGQMVLRILKEERPDFLAVVFDEPGPTFRDAIDPQYKANRPPLAEELSVQFPYIFRLTDALGVTRLSLAGYEADDLLATVALEAEKRGHEVVVVTSDKDLTQVVTERVTLLDTMDNRRTGIPEVKEKFGVEPSRVREVQALMGDSVDNVPGVPGVGAKTATRLIQEHGSVEELLAHLDKLKPGKVRSSLEAHAEDARRSLKLVTLCTQVPLAFDIEAWAPRPPDATTLRPLVDELGLTRLARELLPPPPSAVSYQDYHAILTEEDFERMLERLRRASAVAVDTETTSKEPVQADLVGISLSFKKHESFYIPVGHRYIGAPSQLPLERVLAGLKPILENPEVTKFGQNAKYDMIVFAKYGVRVRGLECDTMIASYCLDPSRRSHSLASLAEDHLNHRMILFEHVTGKGKEQVTFDMVPVEQATTYSAEDADVTFQLAGILLPRVREARLWNLFADVEVPLVEVLVAMERNGVLVDVAFLRRLAGEFDKDLRALEAECRSLAGEAFNLDSPKQLQVILFDKLGLTKGRKTKTGWSTDEEVLASLAAEHPLPAKLLAYRSLAKLKHGYVDSLPELVYPKTGRIHTSYNQTVAATGRLSSSDPNLQNIPIRTEEGRKIRQAFVPAPGCRFVSADYSQVELRVLAHLAADDALLASFREGKDIHTLTAMEVFGAAADSVTSEQRRQAKAINFGIIYGMGAAGLAAQLGIKREAAQEYIEAYFRRYPRVRAFLDGVVAEAQRTRTVTTLLGRRRPLPDIASQNPGLRAAAERMAVNTPVQGTAADLMKVAMLRLHRALEEKGLLSKMILQVHDELVFECPEAEVETLKKLARDEMESALELKVPLVVDLSVGSNWAEL
ncbi:MAG: DNA polymerase I [Planctomycetes bacterium]|nr:DNA polymerase I [Planctomycetota bacterium]